MSRTVVAIALAGALVAAGALELLGQTVPPATKAEVDKLIAVLKSDAPHKEKADACRQLGVIGTKDAVPALAALLPDEKLSHMARYGLEPNPDPSVDEALRGALGKLKGRLLAGVIGSLGVRRDAKAVPAIARLLGDADPDVAQAAGRALGSIATAEAATALQGALAGVSAANKVALCEGMLRAAESLAAQGNRDQALAIYDRLRALPEPHQVRAAGLRGAMLVRGKEGLALLKEHLGSKDYILFSAAVRTTHEMPGAEVTAALAAALPALPADGQVLVIQTLAHRADAAAMPAILALARTAGKPVRLAAVRAAAAFPAAAQDLLKLIQDSDPEVAQAAKESLAALSGPQVDAAVMEMLAAPDAARRALAMELIGRRRMTAAAGALLKAAAGDADAAGRAAAIRTLGDLAGPAELPALIDLLMRAKEPQAVAAAEQAVSAACLRADKPESCTERLIGMLPKAQASQKAALLHVLGGVGGPAALKAVRDCLGDADKEVHVAAVRTLCAWKDIEVLPDLLALARKTDNPTDRALGLRGYLGWASNNKTPAAERMSICKQAEGMVQKPEEKRLLLSALGSIATPEAIAMIMPHVDDAATKAEACAAVVSAAEKILKGPGAARAAPRLLEPLQKVAQAAAGDMANRAKAALAQAQQAEKAPPKSPARKKQ